MSPTHRSARRGLSLLEVMLALAILGGSLAVLGQLVRIGSLSAASARDSTTAQLLAESKMAEIASGITLPETILQQPIDAYGEWLYSVEAQPIDQQGLIAVYVTVEQDRNLNSRPVIFSLTRWIVDPQVEEAARLEAEERKSVGADANQGQAGTAQPAASGLGGGGFPGGGGAGGNGNNGAGGNGPGSNGPGGDQDDLRGGRQQGGFGGP